MDYNGSGYDRCGLISVGGFFSFASLSFFTSLMDCGSKGIRLAACKDLATTDQMCLSQWSGSSLDPTPLQLTWMDWDGFGSSMALLLKRGRWGSAQAELTSGWGGILRVRRREPQ